jgi:hypothetical protein
MLESEMRKWQEHADRITKEKEQIRKERGNETERYLKEKHEWKLSQEGFTREKRGWQLAKEELMRWVKQKEDQFSTTLEGEQNSWEQECNELVERISVLREQYEVEHSSERTGWQHERRELVQQIQTAATAEAAAIKRATDMEAVLADVKVKLEDAERKAEEADAEAEAMTAEASAYVRKIENAAAEANKEARAEYKRKHEQAQAQIRVVVPQEPQQWEIERQQLLLEFQQTESELLAEIAHLHAQQQIAGCASPENRGLGFGQRVDERLQVPPPPRPLEPSPAPRQNYPATSPSRASPTPGVTPRREKEAGRSTGHRQIEGSDIQYHPHALSYRHASPTFPQSEQQQRSPTLGY